MLLAVLHSVCSAHLNWNRAQRVFQRNLWINNLRGSHNIHVPVCLQLCRCTVICF